MPTTLPFVSHPLLVFPGHARRSETTAFGQQKAPTRSGCGSTPPSEKVHSMELTWKWKTPCLVFGKWSSKASCSTSMFVAASVPLHWHRCRRFTPIACKSLTARRLEALGAVAKTLRRMFWPALNRSAGARRMAPVSRGQTRVRPEEKETMAQGRRLLETSNRWVGLEDMSDMTRPFGLRSRLVTRMDVWACPGRLVACRFKAEKR